MFCIVARRTGRCLLLERLHDDTLMLQHDDVLLIAVHQVTRHHVPVGVQQLDVLVYYVAVAGVLLSLPLGAHSHAT